MIKLYKCFSYIYVLFAGKKIRQVKCKRKDDQSIVADKICEKGVEKPQDEMACNAEACAPRFVNELCYGVEVLTLRHFIVAKSLQWLIYLCQQASVYITQSLTERSHFVFRK